MYMYVIFLLSMSLVTGAADTAPLPPDPLYLPSPPFALSRSRPPLPLYFKTRPC